MTDNGTPEGAHESATTTRQDARPSSTTTSPAPMSLEDIHAAFLAGYELGKAEQVELDVHDRALALLHARSLEMLGMARRHALVKGPCWAAMCEESGRR